MVINYRFKFVREEAHWVNFANDIFRDFQVRIPFELPVDDKIQILQIKSTISHVKDDLTMANLINKGLHGFAYGQFYVQNLHINRELKWSTLVLSLNHFCNISTCRNQ